MRHEQRDLELPSPAQLLEEINLPPALARRLAGAVVAVDTLPEEAARTRRIPAPDGYPARLAPDGMIWNDYCPLRLEFEDGSGRTWHLPRHWLSRAPERVTDDTVVPGPGTREVMSLPDVWDLLEINLPVEIAIELSGRWVEVWVRHGVAGPEVHRPDAHGKEWRFPASWRRRHVRLPSAAHLAAEGAPDDVARECAGTIATVNYHRGSICCLPAHYRYKDRAGNKWPVRVDDCEIVGFGEVLDARQ